MNKNRSHGKIDRLPYNLRLQVERRLINGDTYREISEWLKGIGHDISLMSVFRYGKPFLKRWEAVKNAKLTAEVLIQRK